MNDLFKIRDFGPMLLDEIKKPFDDENYLFELKFDGYRALLFISDKKVQIYNRHHQEITNLYPELQNLKRKGNYILDGEIVVMENGVPSFSKLQERAHLKDKTKIKLKSASLPVVFVAFDCLYANKDITNKTLEERKKVLAKFLENDYFLISKAYTGQGKKLFKFVQKYNLEGIVAKKKDSTYEINTRSRNWIKIKNYHYKNFYAVATLAEHNYLKVYLAKKVKQKFQYVGKVLVYDNNPAYEMLKKVKFKKYVVQDLDLNLKTINPCYKLKVGFIEQTTNNELRQPFFVAILPN